MRQNALVATRLPFLSIAARGRHRAHQRVFIDNRTSGSLSQRGYGRACPRAAQYALVFEFLEDRNFGSALRVNARLEPYFQHAVDFKKETYLHSRGNTYEVNFDNCSAAVLSKRIRAKCSDGRQRAVGAGETEGTRGLQAAGYGRRYKTMGRGLC
jgi:hypothetical protein